MNDSITDENAILFAMGFYDALGVGKDIEFAFNYAITTIETEGFQGENIPVLLRNAQ